MHVSYPRPDRTYSNLSVGGFAVMVLLLVALFELAPWLEKHGHPFWALGVKFAAGFGLVFRLLFLL